MDTNQTQELQYEIGMDRADAFQIKENQENKNESQKNTENGSFEDRVNDVLDKLRPNIRMDGGDIQLIKADEKTGVVKVRLVGACRSCAMSTTTLHHFIETILKKKMPEVKVVESVNQ